MKREKYTLPLMLIFSLFFLWAISNNLLPTMIRQLMKTCELTAFEASFTETAYWMAYFIFPIPIAMFMKRYSYKAGILFGLLLAAFGSLLFFPAAMIKSYWAYLGVFFIIATGICFLETAANPYVTVLGDPETASKRLNLAQSFNGLGAFIAAMFFSKLILSGQHYTRETLPADYVGGWEGYIQFETDSMKLPYLLLAGMLIVIAVVFYASKIPPIPEEENKDHASTEKLIDFRVLKRSHLRWGVISQFFYNGGQTAINSLFLVYCCTYAGISEDMATTFFGIYMLAFSLVNIVLCGVITVYGGLVGVYAMIAISFFMSIMYPTQFSLAVTDLGRETKSGSAFLVMAIVGNACLPQLTAFVMSHYPTMYQVSYLIPLVCFVFCAYYGWKGYRIID